MQSNFAKNPRKCASKSNYNFYEIEKVMLDTLLKFSKSNRYITFLKKCNRYSTDTLHYITYMHWLRVTRK